MNELSLHIYDIVQNSIRAEATNVLITIDENDILNELKISIKDDGLGMNDEVLKKVKDPFYTTRTTRGVGLGISLFELAANQSNGFLSIDTEIGKGTTVTALFQKDHIDKSPMGNLAETIYLLSLNKVNILYKHIINGKSFIYDKMEVLEVLGDVSLANIEVKSWLEDYIKKNINIMSGIT